MVAVGGGGQFASSVPGGLVGVMWQPRSMSTVWPPGQVFALRLCAAVPIRRVCGTTVVTAWRWAGGPIPAWTPTGRGSATTTIVVRCQPGPVRSGLEGATVRWHGHTNQPEPDTAPPSVNDPSDSGQLWGGSLGAQSQGGRTVSKSQYESLEAKSFFAGLFDMKFKTFITPKIARLLYILLMIAVVIQFVAIVVIFDDDAGLGIMIGVVYSFIALVFSRLVVEAAIAFFSAVADLRSLAAGMADDADGV